MSEVTTYLNTIWSMAELDPEFISYQSLMESKTPGMASAMSAMQARADECARAVVALMRAGVPDGDGAFAATFMEYMTPHMQVFVRAGMNVDEVMQVVLSMFTVAMQAAQAEGGAA